MATIQEAKAQAQQARQQAEQQRKALEEAQKRVSQVSQTQLRTQQQGLQGRQQRQQTAQVRQQIQGQLQNVGAYEQQISAYEQNIKEAEQQQQQTQRYTNAVKAYLGLTSFSAGIRSYPKEILKAAKKEAERIEAANTVRTIENIPTLNLSSRGLQESYVGDFTPISRVPSNAYVNVPSNLGTTGTIFLRPEEAGLVRPEKGGVNVEIPEPSAGTTSGGRLPTAPNRDIYLNKYLTTLVGSANIPQNTYTQSAQSLVPFSLAPIPQPSTMDTKQSFLDKLLGTAQKVREEVLTPVKREIIKQQLKVGGVEPTEENIQKYREIESQVRSGVPLYMITDEGNVASLNQQYQEPRDVGTLLFFGAGATPGAVATTIVQEPKTFFLGTLERQGGTSNIKLLSQTSTPEKDIFGLGFTKIAENVKYEPGLTGGYTFEFNKMLKFPYLMQTTKPQITEVETIKNIEPFIGASIIQDTGKARYVFKYKGFSNLLDLDSFGSVVRTQTTMRYSEPTTDVFGIVTRAMKQETDNSFLNIVGGDIKLLINKGERKLSYKIPKVLTRGTIFEIKQAGQEEKGVEILFPNTNIKKTPLSLTFQEQKAVAQAVSTQRQAAESAFEKATGIKTLPKATLNVLEGEQPPAPQAATQPYNFNFLRSSPQQDIFTYQAYPPQTNQPQNLFLSPSFNTDIKLKTEARDILRLDQLPQQKQIEQVRELFRISEDVLPQQRERVLERTLQRTLQRQKTIQRERSIERTREVPILRTPRTPYRNRTPFKDALDNLLGKGAKPEEFKVFGRRFGKESILTKKKTLGEAKEALVKFLKGTLGRSGRIVAEGKAIEFSKLNLGKEFRPAKKDITRVVQKSRFSLGTGAERKEIQMFRKKGKKKKRRIL